MSNFHLDFSSEMIFKKISSGDKWIKLAIIEERNKEHALIILKPKKMSTKEAMPKVME